jgi:hypothetical protein
MRENWNPGVLLVVGSVLSAFLTATCFAEFQTDDARLSVHGLGELATILVTPLTLGLVWFTAVLAKETRRVWTESRTPQVVVTMEPAAVSLMYVDLVVENVGGGPAFDVRVALDPDVNVTRKTRPLRVSEAAILRPPTLKPGQRLATFLGAWAEIQPATTKATCRCRDASGNELVFENIIDLGMYTGIARLGEDPAHQLASEVEAIRKAIEGIARGGRLEVNTHDEADRAREQAALSDHYRMLSEQLGKQLKP